MIPEVAIFNTFKLYDWVSSSMFPYSQYKTTTCLSPPTHLVPGRPQTSPWCLSSCICQALRQSFLVQRGEVHSFMIRTSQIKVRPISWKKKVEQGFCKGNIWFKKKVRLFVFLGNQIWFLQFCVTFCKDIIDGLVAETSNKRLHPSRERFVHLPLLEVHQTQKCRLGGDMLVARRVI